MMNEPYQIPPSCKECNRRKVRCDRRTPCRACSERGEGHLCHPRLVPRGRNRGGQQNGTDRDAPESSSFANVLAEMSTLRRRLDDVEAMLGIMREPRTALNVDDSVGLAENKLAGAIEEAALGIGEHRRWHGDTLLRESSLPAEHGGSWFSSIPFHGVLETLPERNQSQVLVEMYFDRLNWMFGCLHRDTVIRQHDTFWSAYEQGLPEDGMMLALILAILSVSAYFFDDHISYPLMPSPQNMEKLAAVWFNSSLATFFRCDGMTSPSLYACQTLITLKFAFNLSGNTGMHISMVQVLNGLARTMNLHLLGDNQTGSDAAALRRELARRVWWQIVEEDWSFLPYHQYSTIAPHHFNTALPVLPNDLHMSISVGRGVNSLSFLLTCCRSARILYDLYGTLGPSETPSYKSVLSASENLNKLCESLPDREREPHSVPYIENPNEMIVERYLKMMMAYRSYLIHRAFFPKSLKEDKYPESRKRCVDAAETIFLFSQRGLPSPFYRMWTVTLWVVSAGIVLALDLVYTPDYASMAASKSLQRQKIKGITDMLRRVSDRSGIGARGAALISHLSSVEIQISHGRDLCEPLLTRQQIIDLVGAQGCTASTVPAVDRGAPSNDVETQTLSYRSIFEQRTQSPSEEMASTFDGTLPNGCMAGSKTSSGFPTDFFEPSGMEIDYGQLDFIFQNFFPNHEG